MGQLFHPLPHQIRVLLIELEEARGNHVALDEEVSSADISSTSEVITQHLVTFRGVEELQQQNQRLLVALRELSEAQEREEEETTGTKCDILNCPYSLQIIYVLLSTQAPKISFRLSFFPSRND